MLLKGKHLVVTGALTRASIATAVARLALAEGATCTFTTPARLLRITAHTVHPLDPDADVLELDVTREEDLAAAAGAVADKHGRVDGILHSIAFAPPSVFRAPFSQVPWGDVATALQVSTYSLAALTRTFAPLMPAGSSVVTLDFDCTKVWPSYGWMGVAKSALGTTAQYLANELGHRGIRVNVVSSGPLRTMASRGVMAEGEEFREQGRAYAEQAPLGWDLQDAEPTARACVALFSDLFPATSGERVHVDGGFNSCWVVPPRPETVGA